jgi:hypothetical protein
MAYIHQLPPVMVTTFVNANALEALGYGAKLEGISLERFISGLLVDAANHPKLLERVAKGLADGETFRSGKRRWDVAKAWRMIGDRAPNFTYQLDRQAKKQNDLCYVNYEYMMQTDLSKPVMLVHDRKYGLLPIDGNHRIAKALMVRRESLPAHLLTPEEARAIRIDLRKRK